MAACALLAGLAAAPAPAADWDSVAGWNVYEVDASRCVVGRSFAETGTTFGIIMSVAGEVRVFATASGLPTRAGQPSAGAILLDGRAVPTGGAVGIEQGQSRGFVAAARPEFLGQFAAARLLGIHGGPGTDLSALPLAGNALGLAQGQRCVAALREEARSRSAAAPVSPTLAASAPVARVAAKGPVPKGSRAQWMADADYPQAALSAGEAGSVTVKLAVNVEGRVGACDVVRSSGSRTLDAETCRVLQRRARYTPATDVGGQAVAASDQHTVRWALPE